MNKATHGHTMVLEHRGVGHVHKWFPTCTCGWIGRFRRRRKEAELQYRQHVNAQTMMVKRTGYGPQPLTRLDSLPENLRKVLS